MLEAERFIKMGFILKKVLPVLFILGFEMCAGGSNGPARQDTLQETTHQNDINNDMNSKDLSGSDLSSDTETHSGQIKTAFIFPHGDDIILFFASVWMMKQNGEKLYIILTSNQLSAIDPLRNILGQDAIYYALDHVGPIQHKTLVTEDLVKLLKEIKPDKIYIQAWCGSHPEHDMSHIEEVMAIKQAGIDATVYEFPTFTGYYGPLSSSCAPIDELTRYWNSLIPLDPKYNKVNETVEVAESKEGLQKKLDLINEFDIAWMTEGLMQCPNYDEEKLTGFLSAEKYRLLGVYDYKHRPYDGQMSYEFKRDWPFEFEDLLNYTLALDEQFGADLWTSPSATNTKFRQTLKKDKTYPFKIGLFNKSEESDTFTLSAAWNSGRTPATKDQIVFEQTTVKLDGRGRVEVKATLKTHGLSGNLILWIKAKSAKAASDSKHVTDFVEIPVMLKVN